MNNESVSQNESIAQETRDPISKKPELMAALFEWQKICPAVKKTLTNEYHNSKYADLAAIWEVVREPLSNLGIHVDYEIQIKNGKLSVSCVLIHVMTGQEKITTIEVNVGNDNPQKVGSALTYLRRYTLLVALNLAPEGDDDDGNIAANRSGQRQQQRQNNNQDRRPNPQPHQNQPAKQSNPPSQPARTKTPQEIKEIEVQIQTMNGYIARLEAVNYDVDNSYVRCSLDPQNPKATFTEMDAAMRVRVLNHFAAAVNRYAPIKAPETSDQS